MTRELRTTIRHDHPCYSVPGKMLLEYMNRVSTSWCCKQINFNEIGVIIDRYEVMLISYLKNVESNFLLWFVAVSMLFQVFLYVPWFHLSTSFANVGHLFLARRSILSLPRWELWSLFFINVPSTGGMTTASPFSKIPSMTVRVSRISKKGQACRETKRFCSRQPSITCQVTS